MHQIAKIWKSRSIDLFFAVAGSASAVDILLAVEGHIAIILRVESIKTQ